MTVNQDEKTVLGSLDKLQDCIISYNYITVNDHNSSAEITLFRPANLQ